MEEGIDGIDLLLVTLIPFYARDWGLWKRSYLRRRLYIDL